MIPAAIGPGQPLQTGVMNSCTCPRNRPRHHRPDGRRVTWTIEPPAAWLTPDELDDVQPLECELLMFAETM